jgi:hypothetical protein
MNELRIVKRKDESEWTPVKLNELKIGDTFIMFDSPDEQIGGEWVAMSEPTLDEITGVWGVVANEHFGVEE